MAPQKEDKLLMASIPNPSRKDAIGLGTRARDPLTPDTGGSPVNHNDGHPDGE